MPGFRTPGFDDGFTMKKSGSKRKHTDADRDKPSRRGPMDEMRRLVRILVKLIPHSKQYYDDDGGGNRISEEKIKRYLEATLGEAPRPEWGVPNGWELYLSELLTWATDRGVSVETAGRVAYRSQGRSWEIVGSVLHQEIGVDTTRWVCPLTKAGVKDTAHDAVRAHAGRLLPFFPPSAPAHGSAGALPRAFVPLTPSPCPRAVAAAHAAEQPPDADAQQDQARQGGRPELQHGDAPHDDRGGAGRAGGGGPGRVVLQARHHPGRQ